MVKQIKPTYEWDPEAGVAYCILDDGKNTYMGMACCRTEDWDMMGEKTGCTIAEMRAEINYLKSVRDNQIKPTLQAYKTLYYSMTQSTHFNPNCYESKMLMRKLTQTQEDLDLIKEMIDNSKRDLRTYMNTKAETWKKIRKHREEDKTE